jgi:hypothetical protein
MHYFVGLGNYAAGHADATTLEELVELRQQQAGRSIQ